MAEGQNVPAQFERPRKLLFATDATFFRGEDGEVLTECALWAPIWERYLSAFDTLLVAGREQPAGRAPSVRTLAEADRVTFALLPNVNGLRESLNRPRVHRTMRALVAQADAVVAALPSELGLLASTYAARAGKPVLVEVLGSGYEAFALHGSLLARVYAPLIHNRTRRAVARAEVALYVTQEWLQAQYPSPNARVPWAETDFVPPPGGRIQAGVADALVQSPNKAVEAARARRIDELRQGRLIVFGTVASLGPRFKGLDVALAAFSKLRREGCQFEYRILGPGDRRPWQRLIDELGLSSCCFLDGACDPGQEVLDWLDGIDVHVQPSLTESLSRGTIEAMSRGVACLASRAGGLPEYLPPQILHPAGDADCLAHHMKAWIAAPDKVAAMGREMMDLVKRFDHELLKPRRESMYRHLASLTTSAANRDARRSSGWLDKELS